MCVSAMIEDDLCKLEREYEALIGWVEWAEIFQRRALYDLKIPKAIELRFERPRTREEETIKRSIDEFRVKKSAELEQELFKQKVLRVTEWVTFGHYLIRWQAMHKSGF